jgi:hypothetical protein
MALSLFSILRQPPVPWHHPEESYGEARNPTPPPPGGRKDRLLREPEGVGGAPPEGRGVFLEERKGDGRLAGEYNYTQTRRFFLF